MSIEEFLSTTRAKWLYHFTDLANLPSIREYGLLPLRELRARGIRPPKPGGNELSHNLDKHRSLDAYVHLCFKANHDMEKSARREGRIGETRFLRIDVEVLRFQGVLGCPMVANGNDAVGQIKPIEEALEVIDLDVLYGAFAISSPMRFIEIVRADSFSQPYSDDIKQGRLL